MPRSTSDTAIQAVLSVVGSGFMDILCGTTVASINDYGFSRLLEDLTALEQFAEHFAFPGLSKEFATPRKLCSFILSGQSFTEDVSKIMQQLPEISPRSFIAALEKYRELGGWQAQRASRRAAKRKEIDALIKKLREHIP